MSRKSDQDQPARKSHRSFTQVAVWIIIALLIVGLGGFGVTHFGSSMQAIGSVDDEEITVSEYALALQQELRALGRQTGEAVSLQQANALAELAGGESVSEQVLTRLYSTAALDAEVGRIPVSVGDQAVQNQVVTNPTFQGLDGDFDREAYRQTLRRNGLSERAFEELIREETARAILQDAVTGGTAAPALLTDTLLNHAAERRSFRWIRLEAGDLAEPVPAPSEADVQGYYDANAEAFTIGEKKRLTYVWLTPDMLLETIETDEEALQTLYEERIGEYVRPERRLVERLVFEDEAAATAAHDRLLADDDVSFETLVDERGLSLQDIDLGDLTREELGDAAEAVFALTESGEVTAPQPSELGPALFRMNGILNAQETTFEEARDDLLSEYALDRARRVIAQSASGIDDLLAGGATLEEVADETDMVLGGIDWSAEAEGEITGYQEFRAAAQGVDEDAFPELVELDDGGLFALRLDEIIPPVLQPLDDVREQATDLWTREETRNRLSDRAMDIAGQIDDGAEMDTFGLTVREETELTRSAFVEEAPPGFLSEVFGMAEGEARGIPADDISAVVVLDTILPPDAENPDTVALSDALESNVVRGLEQDLFEAYVQALRQQSDIRRDQSAINAVNAQFP